MTIFEKVHELGEMIKESEEMKALNEAERIQAEDKKCAELLADFNMKRMNLARDVQSGKLEQSEAIIKNNQYFEEMIEKNEKLKNYVNVKQNFDALIAEINKILNVYITGQDESCTHDCSTCGGCH